MKIRNEMKDSQKNRKMEIKLWIGKERWFVEWKGSVKVNQMSRGSFDVFEIQQDYT